MNSHELKQAICNRILGTSFKDIERAMQSILDSRHPNDGEDYDPDVVEKPLKKEDILPPPPKPEKKSKYKTLSLEETQALLEASNAPVVEKPRLFGQSDYPTYSREQVEQWVREYFQTKEEYDGLSRRRQNSSEEL